MVQPPRDPARSCWSTERMPMPMSMPTPINPPPPDEDKYSAQRPMDIARMLETHCKIPLKHFILAGINKDGEVESYAGYAGLTEQDAPDKLVLPAYIDLKGYHNWYTNGGTIPSPSPSSEDQYYGSESRLTMGPVFGGRRQYERRGRPHGSVPYDDDGPYRGRKRPRVNVYKRETNNAADDDLPAVQVVMSKKGIRIGNEQEVWKFCDQRFKNIQQTACKMVAKAWVKLIAPKKQSNHPYTGADAKAPDWWPKPWGPTRDEKVRHKEPDHLLKPERVHLLNHILRMIVEPNASQHADIQKLNLNVAKLEEAAMEALSTFFGDTEHPANLRKKPYLKEIFKVARYEERYKNGEIDGETEVFVMADDKIPDNFNDDEDPETGEPNDEDENEPTAVTSIISAPKTSDHNMLPAPISHDQGSAGSLQGGPYLNEMPARSNHYHQSQLMQPDLSSGSTGYGETGGNLSVNSQSHMSHPSGMSMQQTFTDPHHASSRRTSSLYASPSEYANNPPNAHGLYSTWNPTTAPSNPPPLYSFHQQQQQHHSHHSSGSYVTQPTVPLASPSYLGAAPFDNISRAPYDATSGGIYRGSPQGPVHSHTTQHGFPNYGPHDPRNPVNGGGEEPGKYEDSNDDNGMPSPWPPRSLAPRRQ